MLKKSSLVLAFLLCVVVLRADNVVDEIIARVGDSIITRSDLEKGKQGQLDEIKDRFPNDWQKKWNEAQNDVLRDLIDRQLLLDRGKDLGITGETDVIKRLNEIRQQMKLATMEDVQKAAEQQGVSYADFKENIRVGIVTQQVIGREVGSRIHISNEEIQTWYQQHQKELETPEYVRLREILVSTQPPKPPAKEGDKTQTAPLPEDKALVAKAEAKAKDILEQLRKGAKFEDLAKSSSDGPTAADGGELGSFKRGELAKELEDKTFSIKAGEFTDVLHTRQGFIIFKVVEHPQAGVPALKEVEDKIREVVYGQKLPPALRAYLTRLREESYIDLRAGYVDTGASANQNKPIMLAANTSGDEIRHQKAKKKKHFLVF